LRLLLLRSSSSDEGYPSSMPLLSDDSEDVGELTPWVTLKGFPIVFHSSRFGTFSRFARLSLSLFLRFREIVLVLLKSVILIIESNYVHVFFIKKKTYSLYIIFIRSNFIPYVISPLVLMYSAMVLANTSIFFVISSPRKST
jgi:hypothetical protein